MINGDRNQRFVAREDFRPFVPPFETIITGPPSDLRQAHGNNATTSDGFATIKLIDIGPTDGLLGFVDESYFERTWTMNGDPYQGNPAELKLNYGTSGHERSLPNLSQTSRLRQVTFDISTSKPEPMDTYGFLTQSNGWAWIDQPTKNKVWKQDFTLIPIEDDKPKNYFYGVAHGPFTQVECIDVRTKWPNPANLASGDWGKLRIVGLQELQSNLGDGPQNANFNSEPLFEIQPSSEPRKFSYRLRAFDESGAELSVWESCNGRRFGVGHPRLSITSPTDFLSKIARVTIETRPYKYVEFKNVHFAQDGKGFTSSYIGAAGTSGESRDEATGIALAGFSFPQGKVDYQTYWGAVAADGKRWWNMPHRGEAGPYNANENSFGVIVSTSGENTEPDSFFDIFEATSAEPGKGLGTLLSTGNILGDGWLFSVATVKTPATKFVQIAVQSLKGSWRPLSSVEVPKKIEGFDDNMRSKVEKGASIYTMNWALAKRPDGHLAIWTLGHESFESNIRWDPKRQVVRLVAEQLNGQRIILRSNQWSRDGTARFDFNATLTGAIHLGVKLEDIKQVLVEVRDLGPIVYLAAKVPPRLPLLVATTDIDKKQKL